MDLHAPGRYGSGVCIRDHQNLSSQQTKVHDSTFPNIANCLCTYFRGASQRATARSPRLAAATALQRASQLDQRSQRADFLNGQYHLFFQLNPFGDQWGHMSWGHAVSADLLQWKVLPVALREENGVAIFSGSTVEDRDNTSGLCAPAGQKSPGCMVAIYTGNSQEKQTQNIAYSTDAGTTWTKFAGNPVIDLGLKAFRDPKVFWHAASSSWVMVVALPNDHKVRFYRSANLRQWQAAGEFGRQARSQANGSAPTCLSSRCATTTATTKKTAGC